MSVSYKLLLSTGLVILEHGESERSICM